MEMKYRIKHDGGEYEVDECETTKAYGLAGAVVDVSKIIEKFQKRNPRAIIDKIEIIGKPSG